MWTISLPVGRSWWRSHQELGTPYWVHTDPPRKELWHLGKSLPSWRLNLSQGSSALQRLVIHTIPCLGYTAHTVRASEQPCRGCLCISSCYPQSKVSLRFLLLKQHIISLQISLQYSPLFTCLEISLPRNCAGETVVFNAIHSHSLIAHEPISSLHWAMFCLNQGVTCRASPLSTSKMWAVPPVPEDSIFKDIPSSLSLSSSLVWVASSPGHQLPLFIQVS